jgi:signal transduction histidine kinase
MGDVQGFPRGFPEVPFATVAIVNGRLRDYLAATVGVVAFTLGVMALVVGRVELGVTLRTDGDRIVIDFVAPSSPAARAGLAPGMVLTSLNDRELIQLPAYVCPDPDQACSDELGNDLEPVLRPTVPTVVPMDPAFLAQLASSSVLNMFVLPPSDLANFDPNQGYPYALYFDGRGYIEGLLASIWGLFVGGLLLVVGGWWLATGRAGPSLQPLGVPLAVATALPFLLAPLEATWHWSAVVTAGILLPFGVAPLGLALAARVEESEVRGVARFAAVSCAFGAMLIGASPLVLPVEVGLAAPPLPVNPLTDVVWMILISASVLIPGLAAAGPLRVADPSSGASGRRLLQSAELAVAGATPVMSLLTNPRDIWLLPLSAWLIGVAVAGRSTIRPLARIAVRATLQRDLIVAATEAERARVAADIHDDALQELTLLVHHLDGAGDEEGAGIARTVSDRLRAICGDLRLPILDDLGVGPALDWLVLRIERLAGGEVRLERTDGARPPADVELAFFRVAQEALGNAVKHGAPPIVVRYRATEAGASLSIDDAGPGIVADAAETAEGEGHFGLVNMRQRAEAIGAILDIRKWPNGGTHVALEWRSH